MNQKLTEFFRNSVPDSCVTNGKLKKQGCKVLKRDAPKCPVIVDFDRNGCREDPNEPMCDYLFVADGAGGEGWVVPLELKKGSVDAGKVVKQLQAGSRFAEQHIDQAYRVNFRPILAYGGIRKWQRKKLKKRANFVRFHGEARAVGLMKCNTQLACALRA